MERLLVATSRMLFLDDAMMLFVNLIGDEDGYNITVSVDDKERKLQNISNSTDFSDKQITKEIKNMPSDIISLLSQEFKVDLSIPECEDLKNQLLSSMKKRPS